VEALPQQTESSIKAVAEAILLSALHGHLEMLRACLLLPEARSAVSAEVLDLRGFPSTPLLTACGVFTTSASVVQLLCLARADVHAADVVERTPIFMAAQENNAECLALLLESKADQTRPGMAVRNQANVAKMLTEAT